MAASEKKNSIKLSVIVFAVLVVLGGVMLWKLLTSKEPTVQVPQAIEPARSRVIAKRDLQAFTLLKDVDLETRGGSANLLGTTADELTSRYLLVSVKKGGEVKREMVAPREAKALLDDAVAVGIPPSSTTSLGGQLHVGDLVDLVAVPTKDGTQVRKFENLMVLNLVPGNEAKAADKGNVPSGITLAVPSGQRDDFALAVAGAELLVTRKIVVAK